MKKLYTILLLATSLFTTSCSDWLDVAPSNQVNGDKLFEVGDGYRNALNGIYLNLGTSSMYGRTMSWGFMDAIAQYYQTDNNFIPKNSAYYKSAKFQFDDSDVKTFISTNYENVLGPNVFIMLCSSLPYPIMTPQIDDIIKDAPYSFKSNKLVREFLSKAKENMKLIEEHKRLEENASVKK